MSVCGFLSVGLGMGFLLMHNQHRRVAYHAIRNPWDHGAALLHHLSSGAKRTSGSLSTPLFHNNNDNSNFGRPAFHHHFYTGNPRYVTVVMPSVVKPSGRRKRLDSIHKTWGPSARAIFVVHNVTEEFPPAISEKAIIGVSENKEPTDRYSFPQVMEVPSNIGFEDGLPRLLHVIRTVHRRINPDFAFFVNDHTYVIPEHLCHFLHDRDPSEDFYAGRALKTDDTIFNSGAAGYLLSRATMEKMADKIDEANDPRCAIVTQKPQIEGNEAVEAQVVAPWMQGNPGVFTTRCLQDVLGVMPIDTRAAQKWHRFHAFPLTRVVSGSTDGWYAKKHKDIAERIGAPESTNYSELLSGEDCCARGTISFHFVEYGESLALFAVREKLLESPHMSNFDLKRYMIGEWPNNQKVLGGYSRLLPAEDNNQGWRDLLTTIRKISLRQYQREC